MSIIKELRKEDDALADVLELEVHTVHAILEMAEKKKIAKPEKLFKELVPKLHRKERYSFTYLDLGQRQYFLLGETIPLGADLNKLLQETQKKLKKAKKDKELKALTNLAHFLELIDQLPIKGFGTGVAKYVETHTDETTGEEELLLAVKISSIEVGGKTKKDKLSEYIREMDYEPRTKMGELVYLCAPKEDDHTDQHSNHQSPKESHHLAPEHSVSPQQVKEKVQHLLEAFKELQHGQAYKGLGLIYQMRQWIGRLDEVPSAFQKLLQQLEHQHEKLKPVLSEQIDVHFDHSMQALDELEVVQTTKDLEGIFNVVQQLFEGWKTFVPETPHPQHEALETLEDEMDWLKYYERIIVPMREEHAQMPEGDEKEMLRMQINILIEEANAKIETTNSSLK